MLTGFGHFGLVQVLDTTAFVPICFASTVGLSVKAAVVKTQCVLAQSLNHSVQVSAYDGDDKNKLKMSPKFKLADWFNLGFY